MDSKHHFQDRFLCQLMFLLCLCLTASNCSGSEVSVKLLGTPPASSNSSTATFSFAVFDNDNNAAGCPDCSFLCELDHRLLSHCQDGEETYFGLKNGHHFFSVRSNRSTEIGCASYNWTVDTIPPTASVTASARFTNAVNISVNISFSEPCISRGGFACSSVDSCNILVYGAAKVVPSSLKTVEPNLKYTVIVSMAPNVQNELVMLVMDEGFCTDTAGNIFTRTENSTFYVDFDKRSFFVSLKILIPEKLLQLSGKTRTIQATTNNSNLKFYLYFSQPLLNSSSEILESLNTNEGIILPSNGANFRNRTFHFRVTNVSNNAIITINLKSNLLVSRQGNACSPFAPVTFLYDTRRPSVWLSTISTSRTSNHKIPVSIKFMKPVFGFSSSDILVSGGHLQSFNEVNRSVYSVEVHANIDGNVSVTVPENVSEDIAGNKNLPSNVLQVRHYSVPIISVVASTFATVAFLITCFASGIFTVSISRLQSSTYFSSDPFRNLFRIACHIQVFALCQWLPVMLPIEYYELARSLRWTIPYFSFLPWEAPLTSKMIKSMLSSIAMNLDNETSLLPLSPMEYQPFFEIENTRQDDHQYTWDRYNTEWREFSRIMFWLGVIGGGLILLHGLLLLILKFKKNTTEKPCSSSYGALKFPRFELFLLVLALPGISQASAAVIRGGTSLGVIIGSILLGFVSFSLLAWLVFLSVSTIHVVHGSDQWTWKSQPDSIYLTMFGPLFEDLRGPPSPRDLLGILRTYYSVLESAKRVCLAIFSGAYLTTDPLKPSKVLGITILCITSFQLVFLVLTKPFLETRVQVVEIVSVVGEVGVFASCVVILEAGLLESDETLIGMFMVGLFLVVFMVRIVNEWYALYTHTKRLDTDDNSFIRGLKIGLFGYLAQQ